MHTTVPNREQAIILLKVDFDVDRFTKAFNSCSLAVKEANRKLCLIRREMEEMAVRLHRPWTSCVSDSVCGLDLCLRQDTKLETAEGKVTGLIRGAEQLWTQSD